MNQPLLILGASARAAAWSAHRAGWQPVAADLFADVDLCKLCPAEKVANYPQGLQQAARAAPPGPWMYSGALENFPDLVDAVAAERTLFGNPGDVLRQVRDPEVVAGALRQAGLLCPTVSREAPTSGCAAWLRKPRRSAGGAKISLVDRQPAGEPLAGEDWYYQQIVEGMPCSAVYIGSRGQSVLIGITMQLLGTDWLGASGFRYAGSIGPLPAPSAQQETFAMIGSCLAERFGLVGLFGVDAILNQQGVWPVEVNPRYTSSIEVLERALSISAIAAHVAACTEGSLPSVPQPSVRFLGKAIIYATADTTVPHGFPDFALSMNEAEEWPCVADIPHAGSRIETGRPMMSVFADGDSPVSVMNHLRRRNQQIIAACRP